MSLFNRMITKRVGLLLLATVCLQSAVVLSGVCIKFSLPHYQVAMPGTVSEESVEVPSIVRVDDAVDAAVPAADVDQPPQQPQAKVLVHVVQSGDTLSRIWEKYTGSRNGGLLAAQAFKQAKIPLSTLHRGEKIELQVSGEGDITGLRKKLEAGRVLLLDGDSQSGYTTTVTEPSVNDYNRTITGTISSSLSADASEQGVPYEIIDAFADLLGNSVEFSKALQPGDTFSVTYDERRTIDGELVGLGKISRASVISNGKMYVAIAHTGKDGKLRYYDKDGKAIGDYFLRYPLNFTRISSVYTKSRMHPILGIARPHEGVDFAAPKGTPVRAIGSGTIAYLGNSGPAGNMITIKHNDKCSTMYLHLAGFAKGLGKQSHVERGQVIGYVGTTGLSTGPHLDFRLALNGVFLNPLTSNLPTMTGGSDAIPPKVLMAALTELNQAHQLQRALAMRKEQEKRVS